METLAGSRLSCPSHGCHENTQIDVVAPRGSFYGAALVAYRYGGKSFLQEGRKNRRRFVSVRSIRAISNHYSTLGISSRASKQEIKQAYRMLARKHHPDVSKMAGAVERFRAIKEAYEALADDQLRRLYDQELQKHMAGSNRRAFQGRPSQGEREVPPFWGSSKSRPRTENTQSSSSGSGKTQPKPSEEERRRQELIGLLAFWRSSRNKGRWQPSGYPHGSFSEEAEFEFYESADDQTWTASSHTQRRGRASRKEGRGEGHRGLFIDLRLAMFVMWMSIALWSVYGPTATAGCLAGALVLCPEAALGYKVAGLAAWGIGGSLGLGTVLLLHVLAMVGVEAKHEFVGLAMTIMWIVMRQPEKAVFYTVVSIGVMIRCVSVLLERW